MKNVLCSRSSATIDVSVEGFAPAEPVVTLEYWTRLSTLCHHLIEDLKIDQLGEDVVFVRRSWRLSRTEQRKIFNLRGQEKICSQFICPIFQKIIISDVFRTRQICFVSASHHWCRKKAQPSIRCLPWEQADILAVLSTNHSKSHLFLSQRFDLRCEDSDKYTTSWSNEKFHSSLEKSGPDIRCKWVLFMGCKSKDSLIQRS